LGGQNADLREQLKKDLFKMIDIESSEPPKLKSNDTISTSILMQKPVHAQLSSVDDNQRAQRGNQGDRKKVESKPWTRPQTTHAINEQIETKPWSVLNFEISEHKEIVVEAFNSSSSMSAISSTKAPVVEASVPPTPPQSPQPSKIQTKKPVTTSPAASKKKKASQSEFLQKSAKILSEAVKIRLQESELIVLVSTAADLTAWLITDTTLCMIAEHVLPLRASSICNSR
jgi:hypothetical protein